MTKIKWHRWVSLVMAAMLVLSFSPAGIVHAEEPGDIPENQTVQEEVQPEEQIEVQNEEQLEEEVAAPVTEEPAPEEADSPRTLMGDPEEPEEPEEYYPVTAQAVKVDSSKDGQQTYRVHADQVIIPPVGIKKIRFIVFSDGKDIRHYTALKSSTLGQYEAFIKVSALKKTGTYQISAEALRNDGQIDQLGETVLKIRAGIGRTSVKSVSGGKGTFKMVGRNVASYWGIKKVQFRAWCREDKSDEAWYTAKLQEDGTYTADGNISKHGRHFGDYTVYLYITNKEGKRSAVSHTVMSIKANNYGYAIKAASDRTKYKVRILNANVSGTPAKEVTVKTWSKAGGRDDVKTFTAVNYSGKNWRIFDNVRKHKHDGEYIARIYADGKLVRSVTYKMNFETNRKRMMTRANKKSSPTGWLIVVDKKTHRVGILRGKKGSWTIVKNWLCGDGKPSSPTPSGTYSVKSKGPYFDSFGERVFYYTEFVRHYYFHSVACDPATGKVRPGKQLGIGSSHGCVRLAMNNAKWLRDHVPAGSTVYVYQ